MKFALHLLVAGAALCATNLPAQTPLDACADQFIDGMVANAPTIGGSPPDQPFLSNLHLCYQDDDGSFFALEYWPERFAPRWAAYRLDPENYGPNGCHTYTRDKANCYFRADTWAEFETCENASDPFHSDHMLLANKLGPNDFSHTAHDRGHIAPRQAFSWHVCATYQTFTMANMSPQRAYLNQDIWQDLERQVLSWAIDEGPLYVVTGTTFRTFPHTKFDAYTSGTFEGDQIYSPMSTMLEVVEQNTANRAAHPSGHILRPMRDSDPSKVKDKVKDLRMPTGYFKVVYRPPSDTEPAHSIGFLLPHSFENLNDIPNVPSDETFWAFVARIDLIEETSGISFPGIPENMKDVWGDSFFLSRRTGRDIRGASCGIGTPQGVVQNTTDDQRLDMCIDKLN